MQRKVGIQTVVSVVRDTVCIKILSWVLWRLSWLGLVVTEVTTAIDGHEWVRSCTIECSPNQVRILTTRRLSYGVRTRKVNTQLSCLSQREVQVWTNVETVVWVTRVITTCAGNALVDVTFVRVVHVSIVANELCTTRYTYVSVVRSSNVLQQVVCPIHVRIAFSFLCISRVTILVDEVLSLVVAWEVFRSPCQFAFDNFVTHVQCIVSIHHVGKFRVELQCSVSVYLDLSFTLFTTLSSNQDYTVSTTHTEYGSCRCVLQYRDSGNRVDIYTVHRTFDTVNQYQRFTAVPRGDTTNLDLWVFSTRLTTGLHSDYTRKVTTQGLTQAGYTTGAFQFFTRSLCNSTYYWFFLLLTETHNHNFFEQLRVVF